MNRIKKMKMNAKYANHISLLVLIVAGLSFGSKAQRDSTRLNQDIEVVKAYKPSVSAAAKINKLPEIDDTTRFRPDMNYKIDSHPITSGWIPSDLKASNQILKEIKFPGWGKISGGLGTYQTPFADIYFNNPNSVNGTFGIQLNHLSSDGNVTLKNGSETRAPFSYDRAKIFGSMIISGVTLSSDLSYQRDMNRFYGYPIAIPTDILTNDIAPLFGTDQVYQKGTFNLNLKSNATNQSLMKFYTGVNLQYFSTATSQIEKSTRVFADFKYDFGDFKGLLGSSFEHLETEKVTSIPELAILHSAKRSWLNLAPSILLQKDFGSAEIGMNFYYVFDNLAGNSAKMYPRIALTLVPVENILTIYAGLDGKLRNNKYSVIAEENRWVNPVTDVAPTDFQYIISGGLKGKITKPVSYRFGLTYSKISNNYFYVTKIRNIKGVANPILSDFYYNNAFDVTYDNLNQLDFSGEFTYSRKSLFVNIEGHFYSYGMTMLEKPPYLPDFTLKAFSSFSINSKIDAFGEINLTGPRTIMLQYTFRPIDSMSPPPPLYLSAEPIVQLNAGAKYHFNKQLDLFGQVENLLNRKDEKWVGYTDQGLRIKLGASFSF